MNAGVNWLVAVFAAVIGVVPAVASAQSYPARPIRIVVGFQAGGGVDISSRAIAKQFTEAFGQSVIVDNRPGAAGNIAADIVAKAQPDGYTLLMSNLTIAIPSLFAKLPFDVSKDLVPVSLVAIGPSVLVVHPSLPVNNVRELIAAAKAKPGQLIYGSGGTGNITHLEMVLFTNLAGVEMIHVPYKASAQAVQDTVAGQLNTTFAISGLAVPSVRAGKVKALAIVRSQRFKPLPDVPTVGEIVPGFETPPAWTGLFGPAGMPVPLTTRVHAEVVRALNVPAVRTRLSEQQHFEVITNETPAAFAAQIRREIDLVGRIVKGAGIKPTE